MPLNMHSIVNKLKHWGKSPHPNAFGLQHTKKALSSKKDKA